MLAPPSDPPTNSTAPADLAASKVFRDGLRDKRIALRSGMHIDDIDDVVIVQGEDLDVAATRQVLKVDVAESASIAVDGTGEIDAADVLEVIALVAPETTPPQVTPAETMAAMPTLPPIEVPIHVAVRPTPENAWPIVDDEDAFLAHAHLEPISTCGVTYDFEDEAAQAVAPRIPQRRLGWVVGTVLACCVALLLGEAVAGPGTQADADARANASANASAPANASVPANANANARGAAANANANVVPSFDVRSLPAGIGTGTIVSSGVPNGALVVDGKRVHGTSAVVGCGKHLVKTAHKKAQSVDVPCGGQVTVH